MYEKPGIISFNCQLHMTDRVLYAIKEGKINSLPLLDDLKCNVEMYKYYIM